MRWFTTCARRGHGRPHCHRRFSRPFSTESLPRSRYLGRWPEASLSNLRSHAIPFATDCNAFREMRAQRATTRVGRKQKRPPIHRRDDLPAGLSGSLSVSTSGFQLLVRHPPQQYAAARMRLPPCPACTWATPERLENASNHAFVDFHRCSKCGHVWTASKGTGETFRHVSPLADRPRPAWSMKCVSCLQPQAVVKSIGHGWITMLCTACGHCWSAIEQRT